MSGGVTVGGKVLGATAGATVPAGGDGATAAAAAPPELAAAWVNEGTKSEIAKIDVKLFIKKIA